MAEDITMADAIEKMKSRRETECLYPKGRDNVLDYIKELRATTDGIEKAFLDVISTYDFYGQQINADHTSLVNENNELRQKLAQRGQS